MGLQSPGNPGFEKALFLSFGILTEKRFCSILVLTRVTIYKINKTQLDQTDQRGETKSLTRRLFFLFLAIASLCMIAAECNRTPVPPLKENGYNCSRNEECKSKYCVEKRCAPQKWTGKGPQRFLDADALRDLQKPDYCHHGDHCQTGTCICPDGKWAYTDFCPGHESWSEPQPGVKLGKCLGYGGYGTKCSHNEQCLSDICANGKRCAPKDGTGRPGQYCHHDNHCISGNCICPAGAKSWGFCTNWENYSDEEIRTARKNGTGFLCK